jgi:hypothetical protein
MGFLRLYECYSWQKGKKVFTFMAGGRYVVGRRDEGQEKGPRRWRRRPVILPNVFPFASCVLSFVGGGRKKVSITFKLLICYASLVFCHVLELLLQLKNLIIVHL